MRTVPRIGLFLAVACAPFASAAPANEPTPLARTLTPEEFQAAGLNKLTPEELARLSAILARHRMLPTAAAAPESSSGANIAPEAGPAGQPPINSAARASEPRSPAAASFGAEEVAPAPADTPRELHSRIEGTIEDFSGRAVFVLENGQVWQQRIPDTVHFAHKLVNPEVVILHGLGGYKMIIVPANRIVFVKRIK